MLNEWKEYEQYSSDETTERLAFRRLRNHLTGTARALETVARFYLYHGNEKNLSVTKMPPEDPLTIKEGLSAWTNNWLTTYAERNLEDSPWLLEKIKKAIKGADARWKQMNPWEQQAKNGHNTFNKIYYQTVIASALDHGPLKKYALIENEDLFGFLVDEDGKKRKRKPIASQIDYVLKLTADYLLNNPLNQNSVSLSNADLLNWCSRENPDDKHYFIMEDGNPTEILQKLDLPGLENHVKYSACKRWLDNYSLLDITEDGALEKWITDPANRGKAYYLDNGSETMLERHIVGDSEEKQDVKKKTKVKTVGKKRTKKGE